MTQITDYASLQTNVQDFLDRSAPFLVNKIPTFIQLAEAKLFRALKLTVSEQMSYTDTVANEPWLPYPQYYGGMRRMKINLSPNAPELSAETSRIYPITSSQMDRSPGMNRPGRPTYFSLYSDRIRLAPIPNGVYNIEINYFKSKLALSDIEVTNWLLQTAPDAYLYGALMEAEPYLKNDKRIDTWGKLLEGSITTLKEEDDTLKWGHMDLAMHHDYNNTEPNRRGL